MPDGTTELGSYYLWTVGCQMNVADSERLSVAMNNLGFAQANNPDSANIIVVNSCVVRQSAEDKVIGMVTSLKQLKKSNPDRIIALMGCMVGPNTDQLSKQFPHVDVFMRPQQYQPLMDTIEERTGIDIDGCLNNLVSPTPEICTHVPIIKGCDEFCSFCIIPYRRGRQISRPLDDIVREVSLLADRGVKEVTLLGQTVDAYGHDLPNNTDLADLLTSLDHIQGIKRIRFLTSHPNYMSERIIAAVKELPKVCEHINLPFQAGSNEVLQNMRRTYTATEYRILVGRIRDEIPNASMSTDVIVGFPGETHKQFLESVDMIRDLRFDKVHTALYSSRPGTIGHRKYQETVSHEEKKLRFNNLEAIQKQIATEINTGLVGEIVSVLVDAKHKDGWQGRTRSNKLVFLDGKTNDLGDIVNVVIRKTSPWSLKGDIINRETNNSEGARV